MTAEHKAAIAAGRTEGQAVKQYLESLATEQRRGRKADPKKIMSRLADVQRSIQAEGDSLRKLSFIQTRLDLAERLGQLAAEESRADLESGFVKVAKGYAERKGISYTAFREMGVAADVLKKAGIRRTRRKSKV